VDVSIGGGDGWRELILESVSSRFAARQSVPFGVEHSCDVLNAIDELLQEPEYNAMGSDDALCACAAALLHDVGFSEYRDDWSLSCKEHVEASTRIAREILENVPPFGGDVQLLDRTIGLVAQHDSTMYSYPWATNHGKPLQKRNAEQERSDLALLALKEADGLSHIANGAIESACAHWLDKGMPRAPLGSPLATWMWGESLAGNLRLQGKRAVVDAWSKSGTQIAMKGYAELEGLVRYHCSLTDSLYEPEICTPDWRPESLERGGRDKPNLEMHRFHPWTSLGERLRSCHLLYDRSIHPYRHARIRSQVVNLDDLSPLALYVVESRLREVLELHDVLMSEYCVGLWDLPGLLEYSYNSPQEQLLAPPVVERYTETALPGHPLVNGLMDGLHRCWQASRLGLTGVRGIVVTGVPYPPLPLPTSWDDVQCVEAPPEKGKRRKLRYRRIQDYAADFKTETEITRDNVAYFLYRDLSPIGSRGPRGRRPFPDE